MLGKTSLAFLRSIVGKNVQSITKLCCNSESQIVSMGESARVGSLAASAKTPSYGSSYKAEGFEHLIILFAGVGENRKR